MTQNLSTTTTKFAYNDGVLWADLSASGSLTSRYLSGDQPNQWLASVDAANTVSWLLADHLGSIRDITVGAGTIAAHYDYTAWGTVTASTGLASRLLYAGYEYNEESGLYYVKARVYDPATGRFTSQDPLGLVPDPNRYRYVKNGPTNTTDPTGQDPVDPPFSVFAHASAAIVKWSEAASNKVLAEGENGFKLTSWEPAHLIKAPSSVEWKVGLVVPADANGWIIQKIVFTNIVVCNKKGEKIVPNNEAASGYEAWFVKEGKIYAGDKRGPKTDERKYDTFRFANEEAGTQGILEVVGQIAFVPNYKFVSKEEGWSFDVNNPDHPYFAPSHPTHKINPPPKALEKVKWQTHSMKVQWFLPEMKKAPLITTVPSNVK